jgi:T-complex protein 1 subunit delta
MDFLHWTMILFSYPHFVYPGIASILYASFCWNAFADALEVIPYTLAENAGMKPIEVVTELRKQHAEGIQGAGINVKKGIVSDMYDLNVVQPLLVSTSAIQLATECVSMILKVDDLIVVA